MTGSERVRTRQRAAVAVILATLLSAAGAHVACGDGCLSAADAADALRCDEQLAAPAASTTLCNDPESARNAGAEVSRISGERITGAARAARETGSPALHTATHARPAHRRLHHGALAMRHAARRHTTPELHAHREPMRPVENAPVPAAPARESHPRAALPNLVRPAHHVSWGGGGRLAAALPRAGWVLPMKATTVASEEDVRVPDAGHEANEARGPPRGERLTLIPPASTRRLPFLPRARPSSPSSFPFAAFRPPHQADRGACASRAPAEPDRGPVRPIPPLFGVPAPPLGRADARRMESATASPSRLSAGGVS